MDGVLVREEDPIPGAKEFIAALRERDIPFLVLTNNSIFTPRDLRVRLLRSSGIDVPEDRIWTSALATAQFLDEQRPGGSAYVVGESGLTQAVHDVGYVMTDQDPDYVVLGETRTYSFEAITKAIRLIERGARFIATNPDVTGPSPEGPLPVGARFTMVSGPAMPDRMVVTELTELSMTLRKAGPVLLGTAGITVEPLGEHRSRAIWWEDAYLAGPLPARVTRAVVGPVLAAMMRLALARFAREVAARPPG